MRRKFSARRSDMMLFQRRRDFSNGDGGDGFRRWWIHHHRARQMRFHQVDIERGKKGETRCSRRERRDRCFSHYSIVTGFFFVFPLRRRQCEGLRRIANGVIRRRRRRRRRRCGAVHHSGRALRHGMARRRKRFLKWVFFYW